jgi:hypothetical protein
MANVFIVSLPEIRRCRRPCSHHRRRGWGPFQKGTAIGFLLLCPR